ncbi:mCG140734, partial [Mus musculus]
MRASEGTRLHHRAWLSHPDAPTARPGLCLLLISLICYWDRSYSFGV